MIPYKDALLNHMHRLAKATSAEQFEKRLKCMERSDIWNDSYGKTFRAWFENTWLTVKEVSTLKYSLLLFDLQPRCLHVKY